MCGIPRALDCSASLSVWSELGALCVERLAVFVPSLPHPLLSTVYQCDGCLSYQGHGGSWLGCQVFGTQPPQIQWVQWICLPLSNFFPGKLSKEHNIMSFGRPTMCPLEMSTLLENLKPFLLQTYLHSYKPVIHHYFFCQKVCSNRSFVLVTKFFVHILIHERCLPYPTKGK